MKWSPCENWPCKNSGKCIPDFKQNDHLCNCTPDFTGKHCDTCKYAHNYGHVRILEDLIFVAILFPIV